MKSSIFFSFLVLFLALATSIQAGTKEELVRLQNDVITLQNQFRAFEKILNENNSGLKSLVVQLNDQVAKSNMLLDTIVSTLEQQSTAKSSEMDAIIPEIQTLSVKIEEMMTSLSALANQVSELKVQSKPIRQILSTDISASDETFNQALNDLIGGDSDLAIQGFNAYLNFFPSGDKAEASRYYIGEAYYNMERYAPAIEAFTQIIEESPDSAKVVSALYKRGLSAIEMQEKDSAIADFKQVIQLFPEAPEASLSKAELQALGVLRNSQTN